MEFVLEKLEEFKTQYINLNEPVEFLPPTYSTRRWRCASSPRSPTTDLHLDSRKYLRTVINNAWDKLKNIIKRATRHPYTQLS